MARAITARSPARTPRARLATSRACGRLRADMTSVSPTLGAGLFAHQLGDRLAEIEPLEQRRRIGDAVKNAFELRVHLNAGGRKRGLVLIIALRDVNQRLAAGHAYDGVAVSRLILLRLRLPHEQVAAQRVE